MIISTKALNLINFIDARASGDYVDIFLTEFDSELVVASGCEDYVLFYPAELEKDEDSSTFVRTRVPISVFKWIAKAVKSDKKAPEVFSLREIKGGQVRARVGSKSLDFKLGTFSVSMGAFLTITNRLWDCSSLPVSGKFLWRLHKTFGEKINLIMQMVIGYQDVKKVLINIKSTKGEDLGRILLNGGQ